MAITDYKITDNEINTYNVKSAPDTLKSNAQSNKNWFDRLGEFFISKYNSLLDFIQGDFVNVDEVGAGLTYENNLEWKHALHKNVMIANYSGNITAITTGYRTIIANVTGLTTYDFMDCIMNINGTDYQCADAYESGDYATTTCNVEGVEVTITYSLSGGDITLTHTQNPLDTLYWNIQMFSTVADKVPRKALPASVSNDGYTELNDKIDSEVAKKYSKSDIFYFYKTIESVPTNSTKTATATSSDLEQINAKLDGEYFTMIVTQECPTGSGGYYNYYYATPQYVSSSRVFPYVVCKQSENTMEIESLSIGAYNPYEESRDIGVKVTFIRDTNHV